MEDDKKGFVPFEFEEELMAAVAYDLSIVQTLMQLLKGFILVLLIRK